MHAGEAREELVGNPLPSLLGESRMEQVREDRALLSVEAAEHASPAARNAAVVVLAQRMVVIHHGAGAHLPLQRIEEADRQRLDAVELRAAPGWEQEISACQSGGSHAADGG